MRKLKAKSVKLINSRDVKKRKNKRLPYCTYQFDYLVTTYLLSNFCNSEDVQLIHREYKVKMGSQ